MVLIVKLMFCKAVVSRLDSKDTYCREQPQNFPLGSDKLRYDGPISRLAKGPAHAHLRIYAAKGVTVCSKTHLAILDGPLRTTTKRHVDTITLPRALHSPSVEIACPSLVISQYLVSSINLLEMETTPSFGQRLLYFLR